MPGAASRGVEALDPLAVGVVRLRWVYAVEVSHGKRVFLAVGRAERAGEGVDAYLLARIARAVRGNTAVQNTCGIACADLGET